MQHPSSHPIISPSRLSWLCQPERIEETLTLLFHLNHWKHASQRLLFADRAGLAELQALVLSAATRDGLLQATTYLDGTSHFPGRLLLNSAAENAARAMLIHLKALGDPALWPPFQPEGDPISQRFLRPLYRRITGQDYAFPTDAADALAPAHLRAFLHEQLGRLVAQTRQCRQPLSTDELAALCFAPVDLLPIGENRLYFLDTADTWADLEPSDRCLLDPEGESAIALRYRRSSAMFVFHLPFRRAKAVLSAAHLQELRQVPGQSQEQGIIQGQVIDPQASRQRSPQDILQALGVERTRVCPRGLQDKEAYLRQPQIRDLRWPTSTNAPDTWDNDPWDGLCLPPDKRR